MDGEVENLCFTSSCQNPNFKMFFALSDNSSLQVDFREFMLALCVMRTGTAEENLKQIFRAFDVNSDGKVAILLIWKL